MKNKTWKKPPLKVRYWNKIEEILSFCLDFPKSPKLEIPFWNVAEDISVSKMAIPAIVSLCALSVFFSLKEVMVWDAMRYPTMKFLAVNIVRPCEPHPRFFFRRFHLVFGLFQPKKVSSFFDITFNSGFDYPD